MMKCLENVSLNKATLKQYQDLCADTPFSPEVNLSNVKIEDNNNKGTLRPATKKLRLVSSSFNIPI